MERGRFVGLKCEHNNGGLKYSEVLETWIWACAVCEEYELATEVDIAQKLLLQTWDIKGVISQ